MRRIESVDAFSNLDREAWPKVAVSACRIAIAAAEIDDGQVLAALRTVEHEEADPETAAAMHCLAKQLDQDAWEAQDTGDPDRYDILFRRSRAVSALGFALSGEPDEAIYEASYSVGSPEDIVRQLPS